MDKLCALNKQDWRVHYLKCRWRSASCPQIILVPKTTDAQCPKMCLGGAKYVSKGRVIIEQWRDIRLTPQSPELPSAKVIHESFALWSHSLPLAPIILNGLQHKPEFAVFPWSLLKPSVSLYLRPTPCSSLVRRLVHTPLCACIFSLSLVVLSCLGFYSCESLWMNYSPALGCLFLSSSMEHDPPSSFHFICLDFTAILTGCNHVVCLPNAYLSP